MPGAFLLPWQGGAALYLLGLPILALRVRARLEPLMRSVHPVLLAPRTTAVATARGVERARLAVWFAACAGHVCPLLRSISLHRIILVIRCNYVTTR